MKSPSKTFHFECRRPCNGQGFNEYALIIGLVVIVSVAGLGAVGLNMNQMFSNMITMEESGSTPTESTVATASPTGSGNTPASSFSGVLPTEPVCFDAMCINLPIVTAENGVVDTSGGNGAEHIQSFSNTLAQMAVQLELAGADADLVQLISNLALGGHHLGDTQGIMQRLGAANNISGSGNSGILTVQKYESRKSDFNARYRQLAQYLEQHPNALPETSQFIVDLQVSQINILSQAVSASAGPNDSKPKVTNGNAGLIHQSANNICDQGGRQCYRGNAPVATETSMEIETP
jgi:Flp pilus assembly pilin Flp